MFSCYLSLADSSFAESIDEKKLDEKNDDDYPRHIGFSASCRSYIYFYAAKV